MSLTLCNHLHSSCTFISSLHQSHSFTNLNPNSLKFNPNSRIRFLYPTRRKRTLISASVNGYSAVQGSNSDETHVELGEKVGNFIEFFRSVLPGGRWWRFDDDVQIEMMAKPVTVWKALSRMWELISEDRVLVFAAFAALIVTALSEISIPHFLTASIFTAQSGQVAVFHRNVRLLIVLCVTSGVCSGLRGCFFGIANMILVKRMRETLYSTLLLQDISFFDAETVGDLTSRLGADCQQVSRVIGNDLNLIFRNVLQATGALIYLLVLSRPLGLITLAICCALFTIMLFYGKYQKKAAKLTQEFTASSNEVAQETLSLMRTVRVYGTEHHETRRYNKWLDRLADISLRQSAAYGIWNLSFNTLYHSVQVTAVLIGGMSILAGHLTAEQLTKFILYSEWLIYSTWWVGDNVSSLMQSVGASEKVFQLMDLSPSDQFMHQGLKLEKLDGRIEFKDVCFYYSSRATLGMGSALETLCGQAFGAGQINMLGVYMQRSWVILNCTSIMLMFLYIFAAQFLRLIGQTEDISREAGKLAIWMIPQLFAYAMNFPIAKFLQSQSKIMAMAWISAVALVVHTFFSWLFMLKLGWGLAGGAVVLNFSWWFIVLSQLVYIFSGTCGEAWSGFSCKAFQNLWGFVKLSLASAVMLCLETWYFMALVLFAGYLKNAEIAVAALSICTNIVGWAVMVAIGCNAAISVRVSNELGAAHPRTAKFSVVVVVLSSFVIGLFLSLILIIFRKEYPSLFTNSEEVKRVVSGLTPLLATCLVINNVQPALSGVAIGAGWQAAVAYVNVVCYYVFGIPIGLLMGYKLDMGVTGIWLGMLSGTVVQTLVLFWIAYRTNWNKEASIAEQRIRQWGGEPDHRAKGLEN